MTPFNVFNYISNINIPRFRTLNIGQRVRKETQVNLDTTSQEDSQQQQKYKLEHHFPRNQKSTNQILISNTQKSEHNPQMKPPKYMLKP